MDFFYLEYAVLAVVIVWFARRIMIVESKSNKDYGDHPDTPATKGNGDAKEKHGAREP